MVSASSVLFVLLAAGAGPPDEGVAHELDRLRGDWEVTTNHVGGRVRPPDVATARFDGARLTLRTKNRTEEYVIDVDCSTTPRTFKARLVATGGKPTTDDHLDTWAYELAGDSLRLAVTLDGSKPPRGIDPADKDQIVLEARRPKK